MLLANATLYLLVVPRVIIFVVVLLVVCRGGRTVFVVTIVLVVVAAAFVVVFQRSLVPVFVSNVLVHVKAATYFPFAATGSGSGSGSALRRLRRPFSHQGGGAGSASIPSLMGSSTMATNPEGAATVTEGVVMVEVDSGKVTVLVVLVDVA